MAKQKFINGSNPITQLRARPTDGIWVIHRDGNGTPIVDENDFFTIRVRSTGQLIAKVHRYEDALMISASKQTYAGLRTLLEDAFEGFKSLSEEEKNIVLTQPSIASALLALKKACGV